MLYTVTVAFGANAEFEYHFHEAEVKPVSRDEASAWLHGEYQALECAPRNPIGKILLLDVILDVAKYGGEDRFAKGGDWAKRFALSCAAALGRDSVRVDVPNLTIG
ncbi:MAG: hypothetical protein HZC24_17365 [Rhodocyclales bacterium]|nr:hypothetical protein [Rhodocyclales bacterium]